MYRMNRFSCNHSRLVAFWFTSFQSVGFSLSLVMISAVRDIRYSRSVYAFDISPEECWRIYEAPSNHCCHICCKFPGQRHPISTDTTIPTQGYCVSLDTRSLCSLLDTEYFRQVGVSLECIFCFFLHLLILLAEYCWASCTPSVGGGDWLSDRH
jgi:hypothetical protein